MAEQPTSRPYFLMCERNWVYDVLMAVAGFFGAYTYLLRGNVFCNAQTGNVVLMGLALGAGEWGQALYYLIPISAYILGALVSELLPNPVKRRLPLRWDTLLIAIEMLAAALVGLIPLSAPVQISQVAINFIASMQYNTFRQAEGIPMATTFCTNHIRQIGVGLAKAVGKKDGVAMRRGLIHAGMVSAFFSGAAVLTFLCPLLEERAVWAILLPMGFVLVKLIRADLGAERDMLDRKPSGH